MHVPGQKCGGQKTTYWAHFSLSTMWVPRIEPGG